MHGQVYQSIYKETSRTTRRCCKIISGQVTYTHLDEFIKQSASIKIKMENCYTGQLFSKEAKVLTFFVMNLGYFLPAEPRMRLVGGLTLQILTSQCSVVQASSRCSSWMFLFPISTLRVRSKPDGVRKSNYAHRQHLHRQYHFHYSLLLQALLTS